MINPIYIPQSLDHPKYDCLCLSFGSDVLCVSQVNCVGIAGIAVGTGAAAAGTELVARCVYVCPCACVHVVCFAGQVQNGRKAKT